MEFIAHVMSDLQLKSNFCSRTNEVSMFSSLKINCFQVEFLCKPGKSENLQHFRVDNG